MEEYLINPSLIFRDTIGKGLIGPGSDIFGLPDEFEIISDYPLKRYYSGILFPEKETNKKQMTIGEADDQDAKAELSDDGEAGDEIEQDQDIETQEDNTDTVKRKNKDLTEDYYSEATHYYGTPQYSDRFSEI